MANVPGEQIDVKFCPTCKGVLKNVPRDQMKSAGHRRADGTISEHTHTYQCQSCNKRFEINQDRQEKQ